MPIQEYDQDHVVNALWTLENTIMPDESEELITRAVVGYGRGDVVCPKRFPQDVHNPTTLCERTGC